ELDVLLVLGTEVHDGRTDGARRELRERAERLETCHPVVHLLETVEIALGAVSGLDAFEDALDPVRALAARRALPARLVRVELRTAPDGPDDAHVVRHGDDRRRAEYGTGRDHPFVVHGGVELVRREHRRRP